MQASILDLRRRMRDVLRALARMEPVTILYRGRKRGVIYPVGAEPGRTRKASEHPVFAMWKDREDMIDVPQVVRDIRKGRVNAV
jgi:antitoxin (DNA-binding transcriptional repressor) of toxin-antitoxin stability system